MKWYWRSFVCLFLLFMFVFQANAQPNGTKEVIVTGESLIERENIPAARQRAIEEALRKAVEQGIGIFVSSETVIKNYNTIEDKIYSNSQGYVKNYDVLSENQLGRRFRVSVNAVVSLDIIKKDLMALSILRQQMHYPRLMIVLGTRQGKVDDAARSARIRMEKTFAEKHFDLIDPATSEKLHSNTKMLLDVTKETVIAAKIGLEHHAEIVLTGVIDSENRGKTNTGFDTGFSRLALKVIDPTTAKIFASTEESSTAVGSNLGEALSNSGVKAGEKTAEYASNEIVKWWNDLKNAGISYRITLKNITEYPHAIFFEDTIQTIDNVVSLNERVFGGGFLECDVVYKGKKSDLTKAIFRKIYGQSGFEKMNVKISTGNNIIFLR